MHFLNSWVNSRDIEGQVLRTHMEICVKSIRLFSSHSVPISAPKKWFSRKHAELFLKLALQAKLNLEVGTDIFSYLLSCKNHSRIASSSQVKSPLTHLLWSVTSLMAIVCSFVLWLLLHPAQKPPNCSLQYADEQQLASVPILMPKRFRQHLG